MKCRKKEFANLHLLYVTNFARVTFKLKQHQNSEREDHLVVTTRNKG